jgi:hypothetical protein
LNCLVKFVMHNSLLNFHSVFFRQPVLSTSGSIRIFYKVYIKLFTGMPEVKLCLMSWKRLGLDRFGWQFICALKMVIKYYFSPDTVVAMQLYLVLNNILLLHFYNTSILQIISVYCLYIHLSTCRTYFYFSFLKNWPHLSAWAYILHIQEDISA